MSRFSSVTALLGHHSFKQIPVIDDGNSFYRAIAIAYYKEQDFHLLLRRTVVEDIQYDAQYQLYFPSMFVMTKGLQSHKRKGHWSHSLERMIAFAVSRLLNVRLEIYSVQEDGIQKHVFSTPYSGQTVRLLQRNDTFDLLIR